MCRRIATRACVDLVNWWPYGRPRKETSWQRKDDGMTVVQMGNITLPGGEEVKGVVVEATPEELREMGNLLYQEVDIVPQGGL